MSHGIRLVLVDLTLALGLITVTGIATIWGVHSRAAWRAGHRLRPVGWAFAALFCLLSLVVVAGSALELAGFQVEESPAGFVEVSRCFSRPRRIAWPIDK